MIRRELREHPPIDAGNARLVVIERILLFDQGRFHAALRLPFAVRVEDPARPRTLRV